MSAPRWENREDGANPSRGRRCVRPGPTASDSRFPTCPTRVRNPGIQDRSSAAQRSPTKHTANMALGENINAVAFGFGHVIGRLSKKWTIAPLRNKHRGVGSTRGQQSVSVCRGSDAEDRGKAVVGPLRAVSQKTCLSASEDASALRHPAGRATFCRTRATSAPRGPKLFVSWKPGPAERSESCYNFG